MPIALYVIRSRCESPCHGQGSRVVSGSGGLHREDDRAPPVAALDMQVRRDDVRERKDPIYDRTQQLGEDPSDASNIRQQAERAVMQFI